MEDRTYLFDMSKATVALHAAMRAAEATLPRHVTQQHWVAKKTSPAPWASVEAWYGAQDPLDVEVRKTLTDLKLMAQAMADLQAVATPQPDTTIAPNLKLAKVRRVS